MYVFLFVCVRVCDCVRCVLFGRSLVSLCVFVCGCLVDVLLVCSIVGVCLLFVTCLFVRGCV